ncbi:hypothetical protein [Paenibacillus sp. DMB5]|uniref:hypothetical protein n=1 Tax=Paenibacillus sp. DMB5 TaxID=1780103 RepID=UPI00076D5349|nr:hypothetical protein [Paenibacillus sp. DMB5]KUP25118.1 hypothetical protein AWJ19_29450 [Paenibacillus sp. DMB5]
MLIKANLKLRILVHVGLVVLFHFIVICFLEIGLNETVALKSAWIAYFSPIILLCTTCAMSLQANKLRYYLLWVSASTLPSFFILHYLGQMQTNKEAVAGFVDLNHFNNMDIDYGQISLLFYFPLVVSLIQIILIVVLWAMRITK